MLSRRHNRKLYIFLFFQIVYSSVTGFVLSPIDEAFISFSVCLDWIVASTVIIILNPLQSWRENKYKIIFFLLLKESFPSFEGSFEYLKKHHQSQKRKKSTCKILSFNISLLHSYVSFQGRSDDLTQIAGKM